jgi:hypothetical protein
MYGEKEKKGSKKCNFEAQPGTCIMTINRDTSENNFI